MISDIISDFAVPLTRLRPAPTTTRKGDSFNGPVDEVPLVATAYPASGGDVEQMFPEGNRPKGAIWIFSQEPLQISKRGQSSDLVLFNGAYYEIVQSQDWAIGGYYKSFGVLLNQQLNVKPIYVGAALSFTNGAEGYKRELLKFVQHNRETYFDCAVQDSNYRVFVVLPEAFGAPTILVDEAPTTFTVVESLPIDGVPSKAYLSPTLTNGAHKVLVR